MLLHALHRGTHFHPCALPLAAIFLYALGIVSPGPASAVWTKFDMVRQDAAGDYLWAYPENWSSGVPTSTASVEIGDDGSGRALHCVIKSDAHSDAFELAEHARTEGTTLRIVEGVGLTFHGNVTLSKDRESWTYLDGSMYGTGGIGEKNIILIGGPWGRPDQGLPSTGHVLISATGSLDAWYVGINKTLRNPQWATNMYNNALTRNTGSEIVVTDGRLTAREGLRISTADPNDPGALRLRGSATFQHNFTPGEFYNQPIYGGIPQMRGVEVWAGVWEIDGGDVTIDVQDIYLHGNKHFTSGEAVLRLTGDGVSTINVADTADITDALLDVDGLNVPEGVYKVIDADSFIGTNLRFAPGTDTDMWSFQFDTDDGDLLLTYGTLRIMGDVDESGYVDDHDLSLLLAYWGYGAAWTQGDLNENGTVNDDDLSLLLAHWNEGTLPLAGEAIPEPAALSILLLAGLPALRRRRK